jgi:hypothetical protein
MGYRNQMDTVCKALFLAALTNRSVCVGHFNSDYRTAPDIATHHFIDITATNDKLTHVLSHSSTATAATATSGTATATASDTATATGTASDTATATTAVALLVTSEVAKKKCTCLLLQGAGAPGGVRRCHFGGGGTLLVRSVDANYTNMLDFLQRPDISHIASVTMSPGMPYFEPIRPEHDALFRKIQSSVVHPQVFHSIANYVKSNEGVCRGHGDGHGHECTGDEVYISTHLRLENDFISQLQAISGFYQKRGLNAACNNAIIDSFIRDFQKFLSDFSIVVSAIHISTGLGKTENNWNSFLVKNYYEKKYQAVSSYHYEYLDDVMKVAHQVNISTYLNGTMDLIDPHNVTNFVSHKELLLFHHIMAGIDLKKSKLRDLHAIIDFLIASQASFFYGVCASSFSAALLNYVDISGCYELNVTEIQHLTKVDFARVANKVDSLRKNSTVYYV